MAFGNSEQFNATEIATSTLIKTGGGIIRGFLCNSSTSGTLSVYDGTTAGGTRLINAIPLVAGAFTTFPAAFGTGLFVALGGTADVTVLWL